MTHHVVHFLSLRQSSAYDYQRDDNSLVMVGGEVCNGAVWCNDYSNKTLITKDGGNSFQELAQIPTEIKGHCVVFLDNNTLMVIGGYNFPNAVSETYFLDIPSNVWTAGPPLITTRAYHTCNVITDCEDKRQVVVVGGTTTGAPIAILNSVEIYDVDSKTWSEGETKSFEFSFKYLKS